MKQNTFPGRRKIIVIVQRDNWMGKISRAKRKEKSFCTFPGYVTTKTKISRAVTDFAPSESFNLL
jgi:hypothetical protein